MKKEDRQEGQKVDVSWLIGYVWTRKDIQEAGDGATVTRQIERLPRSLRVLSPEFPAAKVIHEAIRAADQNILEKDHIEIIAVTRLPDDVW